MSKQVTLTYIGNIRSLVASGKRIAFTTEHSESKSTAIYCIDGETDKLSSIPLPCGGLSICENGDQYFVGGTDGKLYSAGAKDKSAAATKAKLPAPATEIIVLTETEIACITGDVVSILDQKGKTVQALELNADDKSVTPTSIAASPDGIWLAVGAADGSVFVFQREDQKDFQLSESAGLHKGEVTAILFDRDELRFFSAARDQKLLVTHARGALEPEDRGRANNHKKMISAMVYAGEDRLITGSSDKTCKSWLRSGATKPSTLSDSQVAVIDLAVATVHKRSMLVVAMFDNTIRLVLLESGKFGTAQQRYYDGYTRAERLSSSNVTADRGEAIHELAAIDDRKALQLLAKFITNDADNKLRLTAAKLLCKSEHDYHQELLEPLLNHNDEPVRQTVFDYLAKAKTDSRDLLALCEAAIQTGKPDIGCTAVAQTEKLINDDSQSDAFRNRARDLLVRMMDSGEVSIRRATILSLEKVFDKTSPAANLMALKCHQPDARRMGLIRLLQRKLLNDEEAFSGIRQMINDDDPNVRKTATLLLYLSRKKLSDAIRACDKDINRQMADLESFSFEVKKPSTKKTSAKEENDNKDEASGKTSKDKPTAKPAAKKKAKPKLADEDYQPLLIAVAAQATDTCLSGAKCLALLEDSRAFGVLMQLSNEHDVGARDEVCKALGALGDPRASDRLGALLRDPDIAVRDAAYSALEKTRSGDPLANAADGLAAPEEDIRRRGLGTLVKTVRKNKPRDGESPECVLLKRALNDSSQTVRNEAFKVVLNSKIGGGVEPSLRFALNSAHSEVRREVLTEVMAQQKEKWAPRLLLDLLNDPAAEIRTDAFNHLKKETKDSDIQWLESAITSKYPNVRMLAAERLIKNKTDDSNRLLVKAIDDDNREIRSLVLESLEATEAVEPLRQCLQSTRPDVRLGAAFSLASRGDEACREVLVAVVESERPDEEAEAKIWNLEIESALKGLAQLADPTTFDSIVPLLDDPEIVVRTAAARCLAWVIDPDSIQRVRSFLSHEDEVVKGWAAFALAIAGDKEGLPLVFSADTGVWSPGDDSVWLRQHRSLAAATVLSESGEQRLATIVDDADQSFRNAALIVTVARDWLAHDGSSRRLTACLAATCARVRLLAADAVERFADSDKVFDVLENLFNDRGDEKRWTISESIIKQVAAVIVFGEPTIVARLSVMLIELSNPKQTEWNQSWKVFSNRFDAKIKAAQAAAKKSKLPKLKVDQDTLNQLAFGVYVGLVRQQNSRLPVGFGRSTISVRQSAIRRLVKLALAEESFLQSSVSVLTQTTGDHYTEIRQLALEKLAELGVTDEQRAAIAIGTGHKDLAIAGLELLQSSGSKAEQKKVLQKIILGRNDEIAFEAAKMLKSQMDEVKVCELCFDSPYMLLPGIATSWMAGLYETKPAAKKKLQELAKDSEEQDVRLMALSCLVNHQDSKAFECLCDAVQSNDPATRQRYVRLFPKLDDDRWPEFLVSELESHEDYKVGLYLGPIGNSRNASVGERLIELFEKRTNFRTAIFGTLLKLSGYDQPIFDPNEEGVDQSQHERQHPRHDDLLANMMTAVQLHGTPDQCRTLIPAARWAKSNEVDPPLAQFAIHSNEGVGRDAIEAIGFRARKRSGPTDLLVDTLQHRDPVMKFMAAEGLAKAGDSQGIHILLTAIELVEDLGLRRRAVLALGHLADERAFDVLLKLATEDAHALQDVAAEAIGHLRKSPGKDSILQTLTRLANSEGSVANQALVGLRWLDLPEGWDLIRKRAKTHSWTAVQQLAYNDEPATQDLLIELFKNDVNVNHLLQIAKRSFGPDSLQPELAWAKSLNYWQVPIWEIYNSDGEHWVPLRNALECIREKATPEELFDLIGNACEPLQKEFAQHLLTCDPLPTDSAVELVADENPVIATLSARIIGRSADKKHAKAISKAIAFWQDRTREEIRKLYFANSSEDNNLQSMVECLKQLIWASGTSDSNEKQLADIVIDNADAEGFGQIRHAAMNSLLGWKKLPEAIVKRLSKLLDDHDSYVRAVTTEILSNAPDSKLDDLATRVLPDRSAFNKLSRSRGAKIKKTVQTSASNTHYQARSLPLLIKSGDTKTLNAVAGDEKLSMIARLGAVEGLAKIANKDAEKHLSVIGNQETNDDELRKAAWRGLRRSKRQREAEAK